jgi:hypothetical protein
MTGVFYRGLALTLLTIAALGALDACGKRSGLTAPPGTVSDFPRQYPNQSAYPRPDLGKGSTTREEHPASDQPSSPIDRGSTMSPGMESVQPQ